MALGRCYRLSHKSQPDSPFSQILENLKCPDEFLLLESGVVASLMTADCQDFKKSYIKVLDCYGCLGVLQINDADAQRSFICLITACVSVGKLGDVDVYRITAVSFLPTWTALPPGAETTGDERINEIQKLLGCGTFYFAKSVKKDACVDLSLCAQKRMLGFSSDYRFFWNRRLHLPFQRYGIDAEKWLVRCICGGVEVKTVYVGTSQVRACLISRLSCERMGTRFNVRGVNDAGHVANFVETEQSVIYDDKIASFVQTRGSVPLFWEQPGVQVGSHKVKLSRGIEASAPAFDKHFKMLLKHYGRCVVVNLLGSKEGEKILSQAYQLHRDSSCHKNSLPYIQFDYHALVRQNNQPQNLSILWDKVKRYLDEFGYFYSEGDKIVRLQSGQIRTNCLDCLDRTNCAQSFFAINVLVEQLRVLGLDQKPNIAQRFEDTFRQLWTSNGDHCSRIYAGTGALEGRSKLKDASRSVTRTIQNNLMDGSKQEAMDLFLLGTNLSSYLHEKARALLNTDLLETCPNLLSSIVSRSDEFTKQRPLRVFCGTWNVNGGQRLNNVAFRREASLSDWLLDFSLAESTEPIDIYAIGLEEIVDLNASNIMSTSSTNHRMWSEELLRVLCRHHRYIILNSLQLVGVCLFVLVRPQLALHVRDLSCDTVKTGLGGATGNKGAVTIRFMVYGTSVCFVCSHFAAGQSQVAERNNDFVEICKKTQFPMGRNIFTHDVLFWMGDFNYRIDLSGDEVRQLIRDNDFARLQAADQLIVQKQAGNVFQNFKEGPLNFAPTYKYDTFSNDYDTSEKCRSPAWTDRVLWWERPLTTGQATVHHQNLCKLLWYNRVELKTSDHRPVGALFMVNAVEVDPVARGRVLRDLMLNAGPPDATVLVSVSPTTGGIFPGHLVDQILTKIGQLGVRVLLVKFVANKMWLILADGRMALAALSMDGVKIEDYTVRIGLKSPNWEQSAGSELEPPSPEILADSDSKYGMLDDTPNDVINSSTTLLNGIELETPEFSSDFLELSQLKVSHSSMSALPPCDDATFSAPENRLTINSQIYHVSSVPNINRNYADAEGFGTQPTTPRPQRPPPPRHPQQNTFPVDIPVDPWALAWADNGDAHTRVPDESSSPVEDEWSSFLQSRSAPTSAAQNPDDHFDPWTQPPPPLPQFQGSSVANPSPPPIPPRRGQK